MSASNLLQYKMARSLTSQFSGCCVVYQSQWKREAFDLKAVGMCSQWRVSLVAAVDSVVIRELKLVEEDSDVSDVLLPFLSADAKMDCIPTSDDVNKDTVIDTELA